MIPKKTKASRNRPGAKTRVQKQSVICKLAQNMLTEIERALGIAIKGKGAPYLTVKKVHDILKEERKQCEIVDIIDPCGKQLAAIHRRIAHKYGLRHRTANALVRRQSRGTYLFNVRAAHKAQYPLHLGNYGGHVLAGETFQSTRNEELRQEFGFKPGYQLQGQFRSLGKKPGDVKSPKSDHDNVEDRSWDLYDAPEKEIKRVLAKANALNKKKALMTYAEFVQWQKGTKEEGMGEVFDVLELSLAEIRKIVRTGQVKRKYQFKDGRRTITVKPTPDAVAPLLKDPTVLKNLP
jgi:hypothetical protein